jgi:Flp pilus assembly pilin Flp
METTMRDYFTRFMKDEDGAVTVDYVILAAAIVGMAAAVAGLIVPEVNTLASNIAAAISNITVGTPAP